MNKAQVSVIVPAYNAESTIGKTVKSIQSQSFKDWVLLIVDDGSSDATGKVVRSFAAEDDRIRYIKQPNGGASSARNRGLDMADSEYVSFCDADDTYEPEYLELMIKALKETNADFAMCGFHKVKDGNKKNIYPPPYGLDNQIVDVFKAAPFTSNSGNEYLLTNNVDILRLNFLGGPCGIPSVWTKVYKLDLINSNGIRFAQGRHYGEDWKFNIDILTSEDCEAVIVNAPLYNYFDTPVSLSKTPTFKRGDHKHDSAKLMLDINERYSFGYEDKIHQGTVVVLISFALSLSLTCSKQEMVAALKEYMDNAYIRQALSRLWQLDLPIHFKVLAYLLKQGKAGILTFRAICKIKKK